eukprot:1756275-Pleurochrysis_carterae.AAC.1
MVSPKCENGLAGPHTGFISDEYGFWIGLLSMDGKSYCVHFDKGQPPVMWPVSAVAPLVSHSGHHKLADASLAATVPVQLQDSSAWVESTETFLMTSKAWQLLCKACSFLAGCPTAVSAIEMDRFRVTFTLHVAFCVFGQL